MSTPEHILTLIVLVGAALAALIGIWKAIRVVGRFLEKTNRFFEDWYGTPAEDGHPSRKGVLHRLDDLERMRVDDGDTLNRLEMKLNEAVHELTPNNGGSIKDSINRIELQQQEEVLERKAWVERYDEDQKNMRLERAALHRQISDMIGKTPEEQSRIWDGIERRWTDGVLHEEEQS